MSRARRIALVGEPGIGKSALLDWAETQCAGMRVLRASGAESEADLAFAGLLALLRPLQGSIGALPSGQRQALEGALRLGHAEGQARFAVGAATLALVASVAEAQPVAVLVDDAQWIDEPSLQALSFAFRRFVADPVVLLAAARPEGLGPLARAGIDVLELAPLDDGSATRILDRVRASGDETVRRRLLAAAHGNPLALEELPGLLSDAQLNGTELLPDDLPAGEAVRRAFAGVVGGFPERTRTALLCAALATHDEVADLAGALATLGARVEDLLAAEQEGVVVLAHGDVRFRHPLVRAAVVASAGPAGQRRAHAALAEIADGRETRARHRAAATVGRDDDLAAELELVAAEAVARGAPSTAASLLARAAELSTDAAAAAERSLAAAEAAWIAGLTALARRLVDALLEGAPLAEATHARALHLRGQIAHQTEPAQQACEILLAAAAHAARLEPAMAVPILADAVGSCMYAGDVAGALATAQQLDGVAREDGGIEEYWRSLQLGTALALGGRGAEGEPLIRRAIELVQTVDVLRHDPRHLGSAAMAPAWVDEAALGRVLADRAVARARELGALSALPASLKFGAWADYDLGHWDAALAGASEAATLAREIGQTSQLCANLGIVARVLAARGDESGCRAAAREAIELADELGLPWHRTGLLGALGLLELGLGRLDAAAETLGEAVGLLEQMGNLSAAESPFVDLVEALARGGRRQEAQARLTEYELMAASEQRDIGLAWAARLHGMLASEDTYDESFSRAFELLGDAEPFERARAHLCHGERLRRSGERRRARAQLRLAEETFERLGAAPWVERCRRELAASGARLRRLDPEARDELTPQELQVALQVARGLTNREVAQTLFLSPKTVEFHLTRIYRKLGLNARAELVERFGDQVG